ncbi:MAG: hypothetical protein KGR98_12155 [Verrucomicrobia bacterium]|nr:hypothetical protein [Verrucomicrobiota bacterium]
MKTPRDILLARHQAAAPKLDAIRKSVVAEKWSNQAPGGQSSALHAVSLLLDFSGNMWRELILPSRRFWAGLAGVWCVILAVNFSLRDRWPAGMMKESSAPAMLLSLPQQERLLAELMEPNERRDRPPPKRIPPQARSERQAKTLTA